MPEIGEIAEKVRSKNAGPFWITIDIFCGRAEPFRRVSEGLDTRQIAEKLGTPAQTLKRFDIPDIKVVKLSLPRPSVQGALDDRDMHGAALANIVSEHVIP